MSLVSYLRISDFKKLSFVTCCSRPKFGRQNSAVVEEADGGRKIKLEFNLEGFLPEDLSLKVTPENTLKIEAVHEVVKGGSTSKKEFRFTITMSFTPRNDRMRT